MKHLRRGFLLLLLIVLLASITPTLANNPCKNLSLRLHKSYVALLTGHRVPCYWEITLANEGGVWWTVEGSEIKPLSIRPLKGCIVSRSLVDTPTSRFDWTQAGVIKVIGASCVFRVALYGEPTDYQWRFYIRRIPAQ